MPQSQSIRRGGEASNVPKLSVAIVGATGAVGEVLIRILEERKFPAAEIRPLASGRSAGQTLTICGRETQVEEARPEAFEGVDIVFFAATGSLSLELAPAAVERGAVVIDKSSSWRMNDDVPLVVPEVNAAALDHHAGIISCPNCTTIGVVMALEPIRQAAGLKGAVITTLQAASGAGRDGLDELSAQLRNDGSATTPRAFAAQLAHNVVPICGELRADGYTGEEIKLVVETQKILADPSIDISVTCTRVPVAVGHSATILADTERPIAIEEARRALAAFPGVELIDDLERQTFPTPRDVEGRDEVLVGRIRHDLASDRLWLFEVSDNLRKGAATNAVQIAEALIERQLLSPNRSL